MNSYGEAAMKEMVGNVDPWPTRQWFEDLGQRMAQDAEKIKAELLSTHPTLPVDKAQRIADQEVMFRHVGIPILGWPEPELETDPVDPTDPVATRYLDDTAAWMKAEWDQEQHQAS